MPAIVAVQTADISWTFFKIRFCLLIPLSRHLRILIWKMSHLSAPNYLWFASDMCSAPCKKGSHEKIENINDVDGPMSSPSIHSAVVTLWPVKKGRFFDGGLLADKTSQIQLVSFRGYSNESWTISSKEHSSCAWKLQGQTCSSGRGVQGDAKDFYTNPAISQVGCHTVDG